MQKLISIRGLSYTVPYGDTILRDIDLEIAPGQFLGILGHNGSGKTTLLDLILGNKKLSAGSIEVLEEDPHSTRRKNKHHIVYLSQDVSIKGDVSIGEFLKFHSAFYEGYSVEDEAHLLNVFELNKKQKVGALSTGQQKKVQIIAGLAVQPKLIIIDEMTAVLDPETRDVFFTELKRVKEKHSSSILLATNIAEDLVNRADCILFIENQSGVFHDPENILKLFNIEKAA
jgi:ABC-2 type transport system ATP-binding protein